MFMCVRAYVVWVCFLFRCLDVYVLMCDMYFCVYALGVYVLRRLGVLHARVFVCVCLYLCICRCVGGV